MPIQGQLESIPEKPTKINLSAIPFGKELSLATDHICSQPRKYSFWWKWDWSTQQYRPTITPSNPITIQLDYQTFVGSTNKTATFWCSLDVEGSNPNALLQTVNGAGRRSASQKGNYRAMQFGGYRQSIWPYYIDENALQIERNFLQKKSTNFLFPIFYDYGQLYFYRDPDTDRIKSFCFKPEDFTPNDNFIPEKFSEKSIRNLNPFWTAFYCVKRFVTWSYFIIQNMENTNKPGGKNIGDPVYLLLDFEQIYNGWWNGPHDLGYGQFKDKPRFFPGPLGGFATEAAQDYVGRLAQVITYIKQILTNPEGLLDLNFLNTEGVPEQNLLRDWTDINSTNLSYQVSLQEFASVWIEYIKALPDKYKNVKIGLYGIPDTYELDIDGDIDTISSGWYGEELAPGASTKYGKIWNMLLPKSRDMINEVYVKMYKPILDQVDFLCPVVYILTPKYSSLICTKQPGIDLLAKNEFNRDQVQQFSYDNVRRAQLYNTLYKSELGLPKLPILPIISDFYPSNNEFGEAIYNTYCDWGKYNHGVHSSRENDKFIASRFIDQETLKEQIKICYDAIDYIPDIAGFLWWSGGAVDIIDVGNSNNSFSSTYPFGQPTEYIRKRRIYELDIDTTKNSEKENDWSDVFGLKKKLIEKEINNLHTLNSAIISIASKVTIPDTQEINPIVVPLLNTVFGRETNFISDYDTYVPKLSTPITQIAPDGTQVITGNIQPASSGYWFSKTTTTPKSDVYNSKLIDLDRFWLNSNSKNIIYSNIDDVDLPIFYRTETGQLAVKNIKLISSDEMKRIDSFWTGFSIVKRYVNWCHEIIKYIENKNYKSSDMAYDAKSIGNTIYLILKMKTIFNSWWVGSRFGKDGQFRIWLTESEETNYVNKLAEIISNIKLILTNPSSAFLSNTPNGPVLTAQYMNNPVKTAGNFMSEWESILASLPQKYKAVKIGIHGIPDVGALDTDGYIVTITKDWQGEQYGTGGAPTNDQVYWPILSTSARNIINTALVNKYTPILNKVDILVPQVYAFEPLDKRLACKFSPTLNFYAVNSTTKRTFWQQYTYDSISRALIYNTKSGRKLPIFPILNSCYEYDDGNSYITYCDWGEYVFSREDGSFGRRSTGPNGNRYQYFSIQGRRIGEQEILQQIKTCYSAVIDDPSKISGFLWSNNSTRNTVAYNSSKEILERCTVIDDTTYNTKNNCSNTGWWLYLRRNLGKDYLDPTGIANDWEWEENRWIGKQNEFKQTVITKDLQFINNIHQSYLVVGESSSGGADIGF